MKNVKGSVYLFLVISFILLAVSLLFSIQNIKNNTKMIDNFNEYYLNLSSKLTSLNYKIEENQSNMLQAVLLKQKPPQNYLLFISMIDEINSIAKQDVDFDNDFSNKVAIVKKRLVAYKSVEESIPIAVKSKYKEDLEDALIGYNLVTESFLIDVQELITKMNDMLQLRIRDLKASNNITKQTIGVSFFVVVLLVILSVMKLNRLQNTLSRELNRSIEAEEKERSLQLQLLKYNENLESEITKKTNELYQKVYTHFLSGLPNRNKLLEDSVVYDFSQIALLNIDKFQKFNDVYGEELGNIAIVMTSKFLKEYIDIEDAHLYHVAGDEFAVLVKKSTNIDDNRFVTQINNFLKLYRKEPFDVEGSKHSFMMSAGISFSSGKKMLAYADMALKEAKLKNEAISIYSETEGLEKTHKEDIEVRNKLNHAFENNGIISYFQPISPIQDDSLDVKYESLVRLDDGGNIVSPFAFLDVAKQNKIYYKITNRVFKNTLDVIEKYNIPCSINVSVIDIENPKTLSYIYQMLDNFNYNYLLTVELLETEGFENYDDVYEFCRKIRTYGIKIALDDFGAGYSNFSHILNLPIDYIKIDSSLISNIDRDRQSQIMVETIVGLAQKLNVKTIAEFVSSKEILKTVTKLNVDYAQGYFVGKPEPIEHYIPYK